MSVRIERLSIRDYGPLRHLVLTPGDITVIYGPNEAGKTSCIDALTRGLRERVRPGNRRMLAESREGPGFQGEIDLVLSPEDGGPVLDLLREHPSLARLFIVRDADASLEKGRNWLDAIRGRLIGIDLAAIADGIRDATGLTASDQPRPAREDERQRLAERLARIDAFLADLPSVGRLVEEQHRTQARRDAARARLDALRSAELYERYRLAVRALETVHESQRRIDDLERYGEDDLVQWREAIVAVREAAVVAKAAENECLRLRSEQERLREAQRKAEIASQKAQRQSEECAGQNLAERIDAARIARASARRWNVWRTPLAIVGTLLLTFSVGVGIQATGSTDGMTFGLLAGAAAMLGLIAGGIAIFATQHNASAREEVERVVGESAGFLEGASDLEECIRRLEGIRGEVARAEAESRAATERKAGTDEALENAESIEAQRLRELEAAQRLVADVRERVRLAGLDQLEEKIRERTQWQSTLAEASKSLSDLLGDENVDLQPEARVAQMEVPDPAMAPDRHERAALERQLEELDERLLALRGDVGDRRERSLTALGVDRLGTAQAERDLLDAALSNADRETRAGRLCLRTIEALAADIDRPLREALGTGPGAAGAYLSRLTAGRYVSVVLDENEGLAVERDDGTRFGTDALSRGARDQLALSVRVALVRRLLGEPGFLALDDAFLTSDAGRREALASAFVELAEEGWQILYFTFDGALRDRLASQGARVVELPAPSRARDTSAA